MYIKNDSSIPTDTIQKLFRDRKFRLMRIEDPINIIEDDNGIFPDCAQCIYITDQPYTNKDFGPVGGLTYPFGAVSVYSVKPTMDNHKIIGGLIIFYRIFHELLHHFNKDADGIDKWLVDKPVMRFIYNVLGRKSGENIFGIFAQGIYYEDLYYDMDSETTFNFENELYKRDYRGILN